MKNKASINLKKITSYALALLMVFSNFAFFPTVKAVATPTLTIGSQTASNGDTINVPINASDFSAYESNVGSVTLTIQYDNTLLTYINTTFNNLPIAAQANLVGNNKIVINWADATAVTPITIPNGALVTLNFNVISSTTTNTNLSFVDTNEVTDGAFDPISQVSFVNDDGVITLNPDETAPEITTYTLQVSGEEITEANNVIFSPNDDGIKDTASIDLAFSEEVDYEIKIKKGESIVTSWSGEAKKPNAKIWAGEGNVGDGIYAIEVIITDKAENSTIDNSKTITLDTTAPVIALNGSNLITIEVGAVYIDAGATALDNGTVDMTGSIVTTFAPGPVDTSTPGTFTIHYNVSDAAGNSATEVTRTVNVITSLSSAKAITAFSFTTPATTGVINEVTHTIALTVPFGTNVTALVPNIAVSASALVVPNTGVAQNFTNPIIYTVTAEDGSTQTYVVTVTVLANNVSGNIITDTIWTLANSPYTITGAIQVLEGATLTIEPGVTVEFYPNVQMNIGGALKAIGTETAKITFTGSNWAGIHFIGNNSGATFDINGNYIDGSIIKYSTIQNVGGYRAIEMVNSTPFISYNSIINNGGYSIYVSQPNAKITYNTISGNDSGIHIESSAGNSAVILNNNITNNLGSGLYLWGASMVVKNNDITNNGSYGLAIGDGDATVSNNTINNNEESGLLIVGNNNKVTKNSITGNGKDGVENYGFFLQFQYNNLYNNIDYDLNNLSHNDVATINNWWGTTNSASIANKIYDYYDDISLGKVIYEPYATAELDLNDQTAPILSEVISVTTPTNKNTPNYTFNSNEAGTINYEGLCSSSTTAAIAGDNTITFNMLADNSYNNCTIIVTDAMGNESLPLTVSAFTIDTIPPVIILLGESIINLYIGDSYSDAGAIANDNYDGDITSSIITVSNVDYHTIGTYAVTYNVSDLSGNPAAEIVRTVNVTPDATAPVITLNSGNKSIYQGTIYTDLGAAALDNIDGNITANIIVTGLPLDTTLPGVYTIAYNVLDAAGNPAIEITRTVTVLPVEQGQALIEENMTINTSAPEILIGDNAPISASINVPSTITNAKLNFSALVSGDTVKSAIISSNLTVNSDTIIGEVNIQIPQGTQVSGDSSWTGEINLPKIQENSNVNITPNSGYTAEVSSVIEIGYGDTLLSFNKAVRIKITDQAGKYVGYSRNGVFTPIINACSADSQTVGDALPAEGDCKISVGFDLIIWTKHFTKFATYTQTAIPAPIGGGGGGFSAPAFTAPVEGLSIAINNGAKITNSKNVVLTLNGGGQAQRMAISNSPDFAGSSQESYAATKNWTLSKGDGNKTVYVKFYNSYGSPSAVVSALIQLDTVPAPQQTLGPVQAVLGIKIYDNGALIRGTDKRIYLVNNGKLQYIANLKELAKYAGKEILNVKDDVIDSYGQAVLGVKTYADNSLIRGSDQKIYVIINRKKKHIASFDDLRKNYFGKVINNVSDSVLNQY